LLTAFGLTSSDLQYEEDADSYEIWIQQNNSVFITTIFKGTVPEGGDQGQNDTDKTDFQTNHQASANGATKLNTDAEIVGGDIDITSLPMAADRQATGVIDANGEAVQISAEGSGDVVILVTGTWIGTLDFQWSNDGGATWNALASFPPGGVPFVTSTTTNGGWTINSAGLRLIRVFASAWTSGSANINLNAGAGSTLVAAAQGSPTGSISSGWPVKIVGQKPDTTFVVASFDDQGRLVIAPASAASTLAGFAFGDVTLATTAQAVIRRTTYTEQAANAQRSIVSTSAADAAAGTGARTVRITYYNATLAGPFTEDITLNGTAAVNTVATDICFIESMKVLTVGNGSNAGTLNLKAATGGGGATIWSIAIGDNQTFGAHHYIAAGKTCFITSFSVNHSGTVVGSGGVFVWKNKQVLTANTIEAQISDFVRLYGQSSTATRNYGTPIKVVGPGRIQAYCTPESSSSVVFRASFDFYEEDT
jgi:hypothetical protein